MRPSPRTLALSIAVVAACCAPVVTGTFNEPFRKQGRIDLSRGEVDELRQEWLQQGCAEGARAAARFDDCPSIAANLRDGYFPTSAVSPATWAVVNLAVSCLTFLATFLIARQASRLVRAGGGRTTDRPS